MSVWKMKAGNVVEIGPFLEGMSSEQILATIEKVEPAKVTVGLSYYGVSIGRAEITKTEEGDKWQLI